MAALFASQSRAEGAAQRSDCGALLLRVIHCEGCGGRMYLNKSSGNFGCASYKYGTHCPPKTAANP